MATREEWDTRYASKPLVWSAGPNSLFEAEAKQLTPGRALDIACGEGRNALWLAEQGWAVTAVDFSGEAVNKARAIEQSRGSVARPVNWLIEDVSALRFDGEFDLVSVIFLHTDPATRQRWFPKAVAAVAPGGTFIFIGHDPSNLQKGTGGPQDPAVLMSAESVCAQLEGFDVQKATVIERRVGSDPGHGGSASGVAFDTLIVAHRPD